MSCLERQKQLHDPGFFFTDPKMDEKIPLLLFKPEDISVNILTGVWNNESDSSGQEEEEEDDDEKIQYSRIELYVYDREPVEIQSFSSFFAVICGPCVQPFHLINHKIIQGHSIRNILCYYLTNGNPTFSVYINNGTTLQEILSHRFLKVTMGYINLEDIIDGVEKKIFQPMSK